MNSFLPSLVARRRVLLAAVVLLTMLRTEAALSRDLHLEPWPGRASLSSLQLNTLDGKPWDFSSLKGKVVVLNFWASWCEPCVHEFPLLNALASGDMAQQGLVVVGVNFKESAAQIREFEARFGSQFPIYSDKSGAAFKQWTKGVLPTTILIARDGRARWRITGELEATDAGFHRALERLLHEPAVANASDKIIVK